MKVTLIAMEQYLNPNDSLFADAALPATDLLEKDAVVNTILLECGEFEPLYADPSFMKFATTNFFVKHGRTIKKWADALAIEYRPLENYNRTEVESFDDDTFELRTHKEGKRVTTEDGGNTKDTTNNGKSQTISSDTSNAGTMHSTDSETVNNGKTQESTTKPDTATTTNGFAGFSATGNSLNTGTSTSTKIGSGAGSYTETTISEQITDGSRSNQVTTSQTEDASATHNETVEQLEDTITTHEVTKAHTIETGHEDDAEDTDTVIKKPRNLHAYGNIGVTTSQQMLQSELDIATFNLYSEISKLYMKELTIPVYL